MTAPEPAKPFERAMKALWELDPSEYAGWLTGTRSPADTIDANMATVSGAADKVIRVGRGKRRSLLAVEFQASYKPDLPERTHWHSALLEHRHDLPVRSAIILLRPEADGPAMSGTFERRLPDEEPYRTFRYQVVRLWQLPPDVFLAGGPGLAPLATLGAVSRETLPAVVHQIKQKVEAEAPPSKSAEVLAATYLLMGLRYDKGIIAALKREVLKMEESITYQEIIGIGEARGEVRGIRETILRIGRSKFGKPGRKIIARLDGIDDLEKLNALADQLNQAKSWEELLGSE